MPSVLHLNAILSVFLLVSCTEKQVVQKITSKPNVIIVLTDDQGYGDLSAHGNPYLNTPNMDKLHDESVRFTDFHVDPTCAPTRAALLTGKYAHHAGVWHTISGGNYLRHTERTMADVFGEAGYRTALFGKWHLGANYPYRPMDRGFQEWLGNGDGGTGTTDDWFYNDRVDDVYWHNGKRELYAGFAPDVFFNKAIETIHEENKRPFFIYLATYLPHNPHTVPDADLADVYDEKVSKYTSYFYAGINRIDQNIGKLRTALKVTGKTDNTILIFMADNGGTAGVRLYNAGMRGQKGSPYEGGHRVPFFVHWPNGNLAHGKEVPQLTAHIDVLPTLMDLCDIKPQDPLELDGRSLVKQLRNPGETITERTLFVETQRTFEPQKWKSSVGMMGTWRLVNNRELYNIAMDPGQKKNEIQEHAKIAEKIRMDFNDYWQMVTPNDRDIPTPIVGHPKDKEVFLTSSDWYLPEVPWNHAQVAQGALYAGVWKVKVHAAGKYRLEARRWPKEANVPISGGPTFDKKIDSWSRDGAVDRLLYGAEMNALPVKKITLKVGDQRIAKPVSEGDTQVIFDVELPKGIVDIKGEMLDERNQLLAGVYYLYVSKK